MFHNRKLYKKIDELNTNMNKANISEIAYVLGNKKEIFYRNIIAGIARGVGIGIGITIITSIIVILLQKIVRLNIPIIGDYVADIIDIVMQKKY